MQTIRIGNGQAFWGDSPRAPYEMVTGGPLDYLTMDYLAELTMSILRRQMERRPELGYATDFVPIMKEIAPVCLERGVKVIANAGGLNPAGCGQTVAEQARAAGLRGLRVGIVGGDDIFPDLDRLRSAGEAFTNTETQEEFDTIADSVRSANVYLGAEPILEALNGGANVVVTGRCTDTAPVVAAAVHEFGWGLDDFDKLAAAVIAGHIIECGPQATGGNYQGGWEKVDGLDRVGYPIAEISENGDVVITKHSSTGGEVTFHSVAEQLLYEMGDPTRFLSPDVVVDCSQVSLVEEGPDRVQVRGVRGAAPPATLKVSMAYQHGYSARGQIYFGGPEAAKRASSARNILRGRLELLGFDASDFRIDLLGVDAIFNPRLNEQTPVDASEIGLRVAARSSSRSILSRMGGELAPLLMGPFGATGFEGGRPHPQEVIAYWPTSIDRARVQDQLLVQVLADEDGGMP